MDLISKRTHGCGMESGWQPVAWEEAWEELGDLFVNSVMVGAIKAIDDALSSHSFFTYL